MPPRKHTVVPNEWLEHQILVSTLSDTAAELFNRTWKKYSAWTWLDYLGDRMQEDRGEPTRFDLGLWFQHALITLLPWDAIDALAVEVANLPNNILATLSVEDLAALELDTAAGKTGAQPAADFVKAYGVVREALEPFAALLLFATPPETSFDPATYEIDGKTVFTTNTVQALRCIGQGCAAQDAEIGRQSLVYLKGLTSANIDKLDRFARASFIAALHAGFQQFTLLDAKEQEMLLSRWVLNAAVVGCPVGVPIEMYLADLTTVNEYMIRSGQLAAAVRSSHESLPQVVESLGDLIVEYEKKHGNHDIAEKNIEAYCREINAAGSNGSVRVFSALKNVLHIAIHLRECDLIDYRGLLEENLAIQPPFDWATIVKKPIDDETLDQIKFHFRLLHRPLWLKVNMLVAWSKIDWASDDYITGVLHISDAYSEVYTEPLSPLVYWNEESGEWKFNKELPQTWAAEDVGTYLETFKKATQEIPPLPL